MIEARDDNTAAIVQLKRLINGLRRGDTVTHWDAARIIGEGPPSRRYYQVMERVRRQVRDERGIELITLPLAGYMLADPDNQLDAARDQNRRAGRRLKKGLAIVRSLPMEDLDGEQMKKKFGVEEQLAAAERQSSQRSRLMAFLMRPTMPGRPRAEP